MKYFTCTNQIQFSWDQVSASYWGRYPNPFSTHVLSEDVLDRQVRNGQLVSKRLISKTNKLPRWGERFLPSGAKSACVVEESIVDPKQKTLTTYTRNISLTRIMVCVEKCTYRPSLEHKGWTECIKEGWVESNIFGFARPIQAFGLDRFKKNGLKASKGLDYVLLKTYSPENIVVNATRLGKLPEHAARLSNLGKDTKEKLKEKAQQKAGEKIAKPSVLS